MCSYVALLLLLLQEFWDPLLKVAQDLEELKKFPSFASWEEQQLRLQREEIEQGIVSDQHPHAYTASAITTSSSSAAGQRVVGSTSREHTHSQHKSMHSTAAATAG
jgi:hypothetical protein